MKKIIVLLSFVVSSIVFSQEANYVPNQFMVQLAGDYNIEDFTDELTK